MNIAFVTPRQGNHFMTELLTAVAHEVVQAGARARMAFDEFPPLEETDAYVIVPHEYFACAPAALHPTRRQLSRTIAFCVEQPGAPWFEISHRGALRAGAVMDIEPSATRELRRRGVAAEHFRLGYSEYWDTWHGDESQIRDVDVLFLGSRTDRRERIIAGHGAALWDTRAMLMLSPVGPKPTSRPDHLLEDAKRAQMRSSKLLLNLHRQDSPYFEWHRVLEAICNGCVVVSEHAVDYEPLVPGRHFLTGAPPSLGVLARGLLDDPDRLGGMRTSAYDLVREELPMRRSAERLVELASELGGVPAIGRRGVRLASRARLLRQELRGSAVALAARAATIAKEVVLQDPELAYLFNGASELDFQIGKLRAAMKRIALEQTAIQRQLERSSRGSHGSDGEEPLALAQTPAYASAQPQVSVLIPVHNYAGEVAEALGSAAAADGVEYELVILDDSSTDASRAVVTDFLRARPGLPARLLANPYNRGLGPARNTLARAGRGEFAFFLDADNAIYPSALARLTEALEGDEEALFAYGMIEKRTAGRASGLLSFLPWEPERLREGNYIDAMALFRRQRLLDIGGFDEDIRMTGWEDYDLWCRCAEHGERGLLVPQILARYRYSEHSMLSLTGIDHQVSWSILVNRYPDTLGGAPIPWHMRSLHQLSAAG